MNGLIVSGSSGATGPRAFQFFCNPSLILFACVSDVVRLYRMANELASCGHKVVVLLSRYSPALSSQKASLNFALSAVAFFDHAVESVVMLR